MPSAKPEKPIQTVFEEKARAGDGSFAVALAILNLVEAQYATARALNKLGVAEASTPFGAMELLAMEVKRTAEAVAEAGSIIGEALSNSD